MIFSTTLYLLDRLKNLFLIFILIQLYHKIMSFQNWQFVCFYSDQGKKKVFKLMREAKFYMRKTFRLNQEQHNYLSSIFLKRITNKFSSIKEAHDCNVQITPQVFIVTCPFQDHQNILDFMTGQSKNKFSRMYELLQPLIIQLLRGENEYFYSNKNLLINPFTHEITFPPFSVAGLIPLAFKTSFSRQQFLQVYELLDESMFQQKPFQMSYKVKFRALGMLILNIIFQRSISLIFDGEINDEIVTIQEALKLVKLLKDRFIDLLTVPQAMDAIKKAGQRDRADYYFFLKRVFVDQCQNLSWKQVKECLIPYPQSKPTNIDQYLTKIAGQNYNNENENAKKQLRKLGISEKDVQFYLIYKLQVQKLDFHNFSDLIYRERYTSSKNLTLFHNLTKFTNFDTNFQSKDNKKVQKTSKCSWQQLIEIMCQHFKTSAIEVNGKKILAVHPKMDIINRYRKLLS